jgi:Flp pilus assembly protein TadG
MRRPLSRMCRDERGAILIQVTVAMLGLLAFLTLVVDYGVMWMSRRQAQNSADAGALAGAIALAFDDPTDFSDTGPAKQSAHVAALANKVFGVAPDNNVSTDITFYGPGHAALCPDGDVGATCVRVDVHRTAARGNPLPTFFARLMSITSQDISATATAKVLSGASVTCMRPFAIIDKWDEFGAHAGEHDYDHGVPDPDFDPFTSTFDKYPINGGGPPIPPEDDYYVNAANCQPNDPLCTPVAGTGWRPFADDGVTPVDYGRMVEIHTGAQDQTSAGFFQPVRLHPGDAGATDYCNNIKSCDPAVSNAIGQTIFTENGNMVGPTDHCLFTDPDSLYNKDPSAHWDPNFFGPGQGAVVSDDFAPNQSPRIVPLPVISPEEYFSTDPNGHTSLVIHNILGFFIEDQVGHGGHTVTRGRLITVPADDVGGSVISNSSFLRKIILIR